MYHTLLYYKYVPLADAPRLAQQHLEFCRSIGLKGRVLISDEGMNGTVSGTPEQCRRYMDFIEQDPRFEGIEWKIDETDTCSFAKMHVRYRAELVGLNDKEHRIDPNRLTGRHLPPHEFMAMMQQPDVVVLDTRNRIEWEVGKFKNALTLEIDRFRDFPAAIAQLDHLKDKKILAYCTGGIRCEKATAVLLEHGFKHVFQLHGGIINYGKQTGGVDFEGECYVFDNRLAVPVNSVNPRTISKCHHCGTPTVRIVNCANPHCNRHFVQCTTCGEQHHGTCSIQCRMAPARRPYNPQGYYMRAATDYQLARQRKLAFKAAQRAQQAARNCAAAQ